MPLAADALMSIFGLSRIEADEPTTLGAALARAQRGLENVATQRAEATISQPAPPARVDLEPIRRNGRVMKLCGVCRRFVAWNDLRFDGFQGDDAERLELRTHRECGGTLAIVMAKQEDEQ